MLDSGTHPVPTLIAPHGVLEAAHTNYGKAVAASLKACGVAELITIIDTTVNHRGRR